MDAEPFGKPVRGTILILFPRIPWPANSPAKKFSMIQRPSGTQSKSESDCMNKVQSRWTTAMLLLAAGMLLTACAHLDPRVDEPTALDKYVAAADPNYSY